MRSDHSYSRPVGFNFGGWLSQSSLTDEHVDNFLSEEDFKRTAQWGFNSVRLPVDSHWLFEREGRGALLPGRLKILKLYLSWARKHGLLTILDLHQVPWHSFAKPELENLWQNKEDLGSFCGLWAQLTRALKDEEGVWFDTLNEPTAQDPADWNKVAPRIYQAIRNEDPDRVILLESTDWGSIFRIEDLVSAVQGPNLVYSFHFYRPMCVTHQGAPWWREGKPYQEKVDYPGELPRVEEYLKRELPPDTRRVLEFEGRRVWDRQAMKELFEPVAKLSRQGHAFYCGEFGVYEKAPRSARLNWLKDTVGIFKELGVGWGYWNYKWLDFGLWPKVGQGQTGPADDEILRILQDGI